MFDENLIAKLERVKEEYNNIQKDLTFEEVLIDKKLTLHLQKKANMIFPIVQKYDEVTGLLGQMKNLSSEEKSLFEAEIEENNKKLNLLENEIRFLLSNIDAKEQKITIEILSQSQPCTLFENIKIAYQNFVKNHKFSFDILEDTQNKFVFNVFGTNLFEIFKKENGLHKDNTSEVSVCVFETPQIETVSFDEKDIKIEIFHSSGAGGQNVNKVATAVRAIHIKTGIVAVCQNERSQLQNREEALRLLKEKVEKKIKDDFEKEEKKRKQKSLSKKVARKYDYEKGLVYSQNATQSLDVFLQGNIIFD